MVSRTRISIALLFGLVMFTTPGLAQMPLETEEVLAAAAKSMKEDLATLEKAHLEGSMLYEDVDAEWIKTVSTKFDCYLLDGLMRYDSVCDLKMTNNPWARYRKVNTLVLDDGSFYVVGILPWTKSETRIYKYDAKQKGFGRTNATLWYSPQVLLRRHFDPTSEEASSFTFSRLPSGRIQGEGFPKKNARIVVALDPNIGYRTVSVQMYWKEELVEHFSIDWKQWDGVWMIAKIDNASDQRRERIQWNVEKFEVPYAIDPKIFTPADLGALPGSQVIDARR